MGIFNRAIDVPRALVYTGIVLALISISIFLIEDGVIPVDPSGQAIISDIVQILATVLAVTVSLSILGLEYMSRTLTPKVTLYIFNSRFVKGLLAAYIICIVGNLGFLIYISPARERLFVVISIATLLFCLLYLLAYYYFLLNMLQPDKQLRYLRQEVTRLFDHRLEQVNSAEYELLDPTDVLVDLNVILTQLVQRRNTYLFEEWLNLFEDQYLKLLSDSQKIPPSSDERNQASKTVIAHFNDLETDLYDQLRETESQIMTSNYIGHLSTVVTWCLKNGLVTPRGELPRHMLGRSDTKDNIQDINAIDELDDLFQRVGIDACRAEMDSTAGTYLENLHSIIVTNIDQFADAYQRGDNEAAHNYGFNDTMWVEHAGEFGVQAAKNGLTDIALDTLSMLRLLIEKRINSEEIKMLGNDYKKIVSAAAEIYAEQVTADSEFLFFIDRRDAVVPKIIDVIEPNQGSNASTAEEIANIHAEALAIGIKIGNKTALAEFDENISDILEKEHDHVAVCYVRTLSEIRTNVIKGKVGGVDLTTIDNILKEIINDNARHTETVQVALEALNE